MVFENQSILKAKSDNKTYIAQLLPNGDSVKQLLVRSRYLLYKSRKKWTPNQSQRAQILFELYPDIKTAYSLNQQLRAIYNNHYNTYGDDKASTLV
jgi:hypothetical protein